MVFSFAYWLVFKFIIIVYCLDLVRAVPIKTTPFDTNFHCWNIFQFFGNKNLLKGRSIYCRPVYGPSIPDPSSIYIYDIDLWNISILFQIVVSFTGFKRIHKRVFFGSLGNNVSDYHILGGNNDGFRFIISFSKYKILN